MWNGKDLVYFSSISNDTTISIDNQICPHFAHSHFGYVSCDSCKSKLGYFIHKMDEEDEEEMDEEEDYSDYDDEDIKDMMAPIENMEEHLRNAFKNRPPLIRTMGYWSYKYNHLDSVRQFHNKVKGNAEDLDLEWSLGDFLENQEGRYGLDITTKPPTPYFAYSYVNGQNCDEIHAPRETEVRFQPCDQKNVISIMSVEETTLCRYVICVCVPSLNPPPGSRWL